MQAIKRSPCRGCQHELESKEKFPACISCDLTWKYAESLGPAQVPTMDERRLFHIKPDPYKPAQETQTMAKPKLFKKCFRCKESFELNKKNFNRNTSSLDGFSKNCIRCNDEIIKELGEAPQRPEAEIEKKPWLLQKDERPVTFDLSKYKKVPIIRRISGTPLVRLGVKDVAFNQASVELFGLHGFQSISALQRPQSNGKISIVFQFSTTNDGCDLKLQIAKSSCYVTSKTLMSNLSVKPGKYPVKQVGAKLLMVEVEAND